MIHCKGDRGSRLPHCADAPYQHIEAIPITLHSEFPAQLAQPENRRLRPGAPDVADKLCGQQHQHKQAAHAFKGLHAQVFHIESLFLIETVAVLDAPA